MASLKHNRSANAQRDYVTFYGGCEGTGRTYIFVQCPFCQTKSKAYVWSLRGSGKLCENKGCRAKFASFGVCYPVEGRE